MYSDWNTWDTGEAASIMDSAANTAMLARRYADTEEFQSLVKETVAGFESQFNIHESMRVDFDDVDWDELEDYFRE